METKEDRDRGRTREEETKKTCSTPLLIGLVVVGLVVGGFSLYLLALGGVFGNDLKDDAQDALDQAKEKAQQVQEAVEGNKTPSKPLEERYDEIVDLVIGYKGESDPDVREKKGEDLREQIFKLEKENPDTQFETTMQAYYVAQAKEFETYFNTKDTQNETHMNAVMESWKKDHGGATDAAWKASDRYKALHAVDLFMNKARDGCLNAQKKKSGKDGLPTKDQNLSGELDDELKKLQQDHKAHLDTKTIVMLHSVSVWLDAMQEFEFDEAIDRWIETTNRIAREAYKTKTGSRKAKFGNAAKGALNAFKNTPGFLKSIYSAKSMDENDVRKALSKSYERNWASWWNPLWTGMDKVPGSGPLKGAMAHDYAQAKDSTYRAFWPAIFMGLSSFVIATLLELFLFDQNEVTSKYIKGHTKKVLQWGIGTPLNALIPAIDANSWTIHVWLYHVKNHILGALGFVAMYIQMKIISIAVLQAVMIPFGKVFFPRAKIWEQNNMFTDTEMKEKNFGSKRNRLTILGRSWLNVLWNTVTIPFWVCGMFKDTAIVWLKKRKFELKRSKKDWNKNFWLTNGVVFALSWVVYAVFNSVAFLNTSSQQLLDGWFLTPFTNLPSLPGSGNGEYVAQNLEGVKWWAQEILQFMTLSGVVYWLSWTAHEKFFGYEKLQGSLYSFESCTSGEDVKLEDAYVAYLAQCKNGKTPAHFHEYDQGTETEDAFLKAEGNASRLAAYDSMPYDARELLRLRMRKKCIEKRTGLEFKDAAFEKKMGTIQYRSLLYLDERKEVTEADKRIKEALAKEAADAKAKKEAADAKASMETK